jgi:hypothetical protein
MGIELWARREHDRPVGPAESPAEGPRVRLGSGEGAWLLVQRRPWDGSQATLVADITAVLGTDQCRFGQWSGGSAAGLALAELSGRGIVHVLAFGPLPAAIAAPGLIKAPALDELSASAEARRRLWTALRSAMGS